MVGTVVWGIEWQVKRALTCVTIPRECPAGRLFVLRSVHPAVLRWSHASKLVAQPGIRGTLATVRQWFWWPALARGVRRFVISCPVCAQSSLVILLSPCWVASSSPYSVWPLVAHRYGFRYGFASLRRKFGSFYSR